MIRHKIILSSFILLFAVAPAAVAQNECGDPNANGSDPDVFTCPTNMGVTYQSNGDLTLNFPGNVFAGNENFVMTGTGTDSLTLTSDDITGDGGLATIEAETESGDISLDVRWLRGEHPDDSAIRAVSTDGGDIDIAIMHHADGNTSTSSDVGIFTDTSGQATISVTGGARPGSFSVPGHLWAPTAALVAVGGGDVTLNINTDLDPDNLENYAAIGTIDSIRNNAGVLDFSQAGSAQVNIGSQAVWILPETQDQFSDGDDSIDIASGGWLLNGGPDDTSLPEMDIITTVDFGSGNDHITNAGVVAVGTVYARFGTTTGRPPAEYIPIGNGQMIFRNLESFNNSGSIYLGHMPDASPQGGGVDSVLPTDGWYDDILTFEGGTTFTGSGNSRIFFDVNFNGTGQSACDPGLRNAQGDLPAADCVDLRGGTTAGVTRVVIATDLFRGDFGAYAPDGIVLVDVGGGTSAPEHFVLSPDSASYDPELGLIDKRVFSYALGYDAESQQHKLYGVPSQGTLQLPLMAHAAQSLWRDTNASWFQRQLDLRSQLTDGADLGGGYWGRVSSASGERDLIQSVTAGTTTLDFDSSYQQDNLTVNVGSDFLAGRDGSRTWVFGGMIAYGSADVEFDDTPNMANLEGAGLGLYGSYIARDFFVDAAVTGNWMEVDFDVPAYDLFPQGTVLSTDAQSLGVRAEAGWRLRMAGIDFEPLVGLSYVRTSFDDIEIPADDPESTGGASASYADPVSMRGSLGVRLGIDNVLPGLVRTDLNLTARAIEEFDGDSRVTIANLGPDATVLNTFDGTFAQVTGGVTISNAGGSVSGYLNVDAMFESDYESTGVEAGLRYQW